MFLLTLRKIAIACVCWRREKRDDELWTWTCANSGKIEKGKERKSNAMQ